MKKKSDYLSKGIVISLILMVINLVGGFAHIALESWFKWIGTIVMAVAMIIFCMQYGKQKTDGVSFGNVFGYGFKIALVVAALMTIYTLISFNLIFPEAIDQILAKARTDMEAKGTMSADQIDAGITMTRKFLQPVPLAIFAFLGTLFFGTIAALLGAAFTKKSEAVPGIFQDNK